MLDYLKLWIYDKSTIENVLNNKHVTKNFTSNEDAVLTRTTGTFKNWQIKTITTDCLEIAGSIHKYWNDGTNENDFPFSNVIAAIKKFCRELKLKPSLVFVKNLEFGVNLQLEINASEVLQQMVCFNGDAPIIPYKNVPNCYFIEFEETDYYFKVYDKGKQAREAWNLPSTPNTLRMEVKGMNSRYLQKSANINTLADLVQKQNLQALGLKFAKIAAKGLVFDDDTIEEKKLPKKQRNLYKELKNPRSWKQHTGNANSTFRNKVQRFKTLVEVNGSRHIYSTISKAINARIIELSKNKKLADYLPNYSWYFAKPRLCPSCGNNINRQHANSKFCAAKWVGEKRAKRCRNMDSNERNNWKRKVKGCCLILNHFLQARKEKRLHKKRI